MQTAILAAILIIINLMVLLLSVAVIMQKNNPDKRNPAAGKILSYSFCALFLALCIVITAGTVLTLTDGTPHDAQPAHTEKTFQQLETVPHENIGKIENLLISDRP